MIIILNILYSIAILAGGIMGYIMSNSLKSILTAGLCFLVLLLVNILLRGKSVANIITIIISIGLTSLFIIRLLVAGSAMPAVPIICMSLFIICANLWHLHKKSNQSY